MWETGYVVFRRFVSLESLEMLRAETATVAHAVRGTGVPPEEGANPAYDEWIAGLDKISDPLFDFARQTMVSETAERLLGQPCVCLRASLGIRAAHSPASRQVFQDQRMYMPHFGHVRAVAFWIPLDPAGSRSGDLVFGSPAPSGLLSEQPIHDGEGVTLPPDVTPLDFETVPVDLGDCVAYSSYAAYRFADSTSGREHRSVVIAYRVSPYRTRLRALGAVSVQ